MGEIAILALLTIGLALAAAGFLPARRPEHHEPEQPDPRLAAEARDANETRGW